MNFKSGDKVRFLNSKGGGVVVRELNSLMVSVAIEDGFEVPTLTSELVLIESAGASGDLFLQSNEKVKMAQPIAAQPVVSEERETKIAVRRSDVAAPSGVYLAWSPVDQHQVLTGNINVLLINHTGNDILYAFFLKNNDGTYAGMDYGSVSPRSKITIETIVREDVALWANGIVQVLFFNETNPKVLSPVSATFRLKGSAFYSEGSYKDFSLLTGQKALVYTVCELNRLPGTVESMLLEKEDREPLPASAERFRPDAAIDRHRVAQGEAEVDLHISALRDEYSHLSAHEIFSIQMGYFERMLESALSFGYHKVTFIHGIGNGSLKQAIIKRMNDYGDIEFRMAPFARYGTGAVELILHAND